MAPRVAAMRSACKKQEGDVATLTAQLRAAGIQPLVSPYDFRCCASLLAILLASSPESRVHGLARFALLCARSCM